MHSQNCFCYGRLLTLVAATKCKSQPSPDASMSTSSSSLLVFISQKYLRGALAILSILSPLGPFMKTRGQFKGKFSGRPILVSGIWYLDSTQLPICLSVCLKYMYSAKNPQELVCVREQDSTQLPPMESLHTGRASVLLLSKIINKWSLCIESGIYWTQYENGLDWTQTAQV